MSELFQEKTMKVSNICEDIVGNAYMGYEKRSALSLKLLFGGKCRTLSMIILISYMSCNMLFCRHMIRMTRPLKIQVLFLITKKNQKEGGKAFIFYIKTEKMTHKIMHILNGLKLSTVQECMSNVT